MTGGGCTSWWEGGCPPPSGTVPGGGGVRVRWGENSPTTASKPCLLSKSSSNTNTIYISPSNRPTKHPRAFGRQNTVCILIRFNLLLFTHPCCFIIDLLFVFLKSTITSPEYHALRWCRTVILLIRFSAISYAQNSIYITMLICSLGLKGSKMQTSHVKYQYAITNQTEHTCMYNGYTTKSKLILSKIGIWK